MNSPPVFGQIPPTDMRVPRASRVEWWGAEVKRILCVRLDNLGDVLMTTPAIHALRQSGKDRHITLLGSRSGAALAPFLDDVDDVIEYDAPWVANAKASTPLADLRMRAHLKRGHFDAAVIFTVYSQNPLPAAMMCYFAGIPRRLAHCRENPYQLLTDWVRETEPQHRTRHEVQRQLDLVQQVGAHADDTAMRFAIADADRQTLGAQLDARGIDRAASYIVIHPGATASSRRYPAERFGEVATQLVRAAGTPILITGNTSERSLAQQLIQAADPTVRNHLHDLSGTLTLGELAALIDRTTVLVANNSGPAHLASALGTPVVDLYALTNPQHTPWQTLHRVLFHDVDCRWCYRSECPQQHHACLRGVLPDEVVQAALELRSEPRAARAVCEPCVVTWAEPRATSDSSSEPIPT